MKYVTYIASHRRESNKMETKITISDYETELKQLAQRIKSDETVRNGLKKLISDIHTTIYPKKPKFHKLPELQLSETQTQNYYQIIDHINTVFYPALSIEKTAYAVMSPISLIAAPTIGESLVNTYLGPNFAGIISILFGVGGGLGFAFLAGNIDYLRFRKDILKSPGIITELRPAFQDLRNNSNSFLEQISEKRMTLEVPRERAPKALKWLNRIQERLRENSAASQKYLIITQPYNDRGLDCFVQN